MCHSASERKWRIKGARGPKPVERRGALPAPSIEEWAEEGIKKRMGSVNVADYKLSGPKLLYQNC